MRRPIRWVRSSMLLPAFLLVLCLPRAQPLTPKATEVLGQLDLSGRVGQMLHLSVKKVLFDYPNDPYVDDAKVTEWLKEVRVGTITNTPFDGQRGGPNQTITGWNVSEWRSALRRIQTAAKAAGHPPILYGIDHLHGANYVMGATLFPQQINVAASFDRAHAETMGRVMAKDTKAAGIQWIFGPVLDLHSQPQWSRCFETFGEDPYVIGQLAKAVIEGIQGPHPAFPDLPPAAATMKHFIAYGNSRFGHDRAPVDVSDRTVRQTYAPPFYEAVKAGVRTSMECYIEVGGVPMVSNREYLIDLLRHQMGFEGMLITDWKEMENLWTWHMVADNARDAARVALTDTSVDIFANPTVDTQHWIYDLVSAGDVPQSRVDNSAGRVLALKEYLGLLDDPFALLNDTDPTIKRLVASVGSEGDKALALEAARDSIALVKNEGGALPLQLKAGQMVVLAGAGCNSLVRQSGGWTLHWQGAVEDGEFLYGTTLFEEMKASLQPQKVEVLWSENPTDADLSAAAAVVVCVGEGAYAEKPGDIDDAALPVEQVQEVMRIAQAVKGKPLVGVLLEGRPRVLQGIPQMTDAFVHAMLPGPAGGRAIADILLGLVNPSARLPFTYPKHTGTMLHQYHGKPSEKCTNLSAAFPSFDVIDCPVEWPFGHGLSYTSFAHSPMTLSPSATIDEHTNLTVAFRVSNTGATAGKEAVLLFVTDWARRVTPEYKLLKRFEKVSLQPGEGTDVKFTLVPEDLSYIGIDGRRVLEAGDFYLGLGPEVDCRTTPEQCTKFTLKLSEMYHPSCQAACRLLRAGEEACGAVAAVGGEERLVGAAGEKACVELCRKDEEWGWPQTKCLEQAVWSGKCNVARRCRLPGRDIFNERAAAANDTTTTTKTPPKGRTLAAATATRPNRSASFFQMHLQGAPSFALGLLVGTVGALSLVFGLRRVNAGAGSRYRYAARFEGGGRHHVLP